MLLLENLQKDSRRITIELVGDSQISPNSKEHFSAEDSDAFEREVENVEKVALFYFKAY